MGHMHAIHQNPRRPRHFGAGRRQHRSRQYWKLLPLFAIIFVVLYQLNCELSCDDRRKWKKERKRKRSLSLRKPARTQYANMLFYVFNQKYWGGVDEPFLYFCKLMPPTGTPPRRASRHPSPRPYQWAYSTSTLGWWWWWWCSKKKNEYISQCCARICFLRCNNFVCAWEVARRLKCESRLCRESTRIYAELSARIMRHGIHYVVLRGFWVMFFWNQMNWSASRC